MEDSVHDAIAEAETDAVAVAGETTPDPCLFCGEPAEHLGQCSVCEGAGCLPPDLWSPGMADPCLTLCVRCAREVHIACATDDEAGNPRCPTCLY